MWARASQPPGHRDKLPGRPTTAFAGGQRRHRVRLGGCALLDLTAHWHRWRCHEHCIPHSHGSDALGAVGAPPQGALSAFLPWGRTRDDSRGAALQPRQPWGPQRHTAGLKGTGGLEGHTQWSVGFSRSRLSVMHKRPDCVPLLCSPTLFQWARRARTKKGSTKQQVDKKLPTYHGLPKDNCQQPSTGHHLTHQLSALGGGPSGSIAGSQQRTASTTSGRRRVPPNSENRPLPLKETPAPGFVSGPDVGNTARGHHHKSGPRSSLVPDIHIPREECFVKLNTEHNTRTQKAAASQRCYSRPGQDGSRQEKGKLRASASLGPPGRRCVMKGPPLGPGGEDITRPNQVAPRSRKASSTRNLKPQTSNLKLLGA